MKLTKSEKLAISITAVFLLAVGGYHLVQTRTPPAVTVTSSGMTAKSAEAAQGADSAAAENAGTEPVNLNTASLDELQTLSGIGPTLAQRIIDYRTEHGPFQTVEDITLVQGIAAKVYSENAARMTVE